MVELSDALFADLRAAFIAEATTALRYRHFAQVAEIEGHVDVAKLFSELSESVACAAHGHIDLLRTVADPATRQPIGDTRLNLAAALTGDLTGFAELYPRLTANAHAAGHADVASWMSNLTALKKAHVARLRGALAELPESSHAADAGAGDNGRGRP